MPVLIWSDGRKEARARTVRPPRPPLPPLRRKKQRRRKIGTRYSRKCPQMFSRNHRGSHYLRSNSPILRRAITVREILLPNHASCTRVCIHTILATEQHIPSTTSI